jgi:Ca-activated chloride channel family protein
MRRKLWWAVAMAVVAAICFSCSRTSPTIPTNEPSQVSVKAALGNPLVKAGASQSMFARVEVTAAPRGAKGRPPVNLVLLVDTSGSMDGRAITDARAASLALLDTLSPKDRFAVVVFHSKAEVLLPTTRIDDADLKELRTKISGMKAQGTTDMAGGLRMALDQAESAIERDGVNRIVLLGDGVPNDDAQISPLVSEATTRGISITTLGLGNDYDETLMGRISQTTGGKFSYVEDSTKVASFFKEEVVRLHHVVARNAYVELRPGPGVTIKSVVGRPFSALDGHAVIVTLGDLTFGEQNEIVVELATNAAKDGANIEALDAVLHWGESNGGQREERAFLGAKATTDDTKIGAAQVQAVADAVARAKDAAATLKKIEADRAQQNRNNLQGNVMPSPASAPPLAVPPPKAQSPEETRRMHDQAMRNFQAH